MKNGLQYCNKIKHAISAYFGHFEWDKKLLSYFFVVNPIISHYGNMGSQVFKRGMQNRFWSKNNYYILLIEIVLSWQKGPTSELHISIFYARNHQNLFEAFRFFFPLNLEAHSSYLSALDFCNSLVWNIEFDELDFFLV